MSSGPTQIQILLVVGLLGTSRPKCQQGHRQITGNLAADWHEQLDAVGEQQRVLLERQLMSDPRRVPKGKCERLFEH